MQAKDIMTSKILCMKAGMNIIEAAKLLVENRISGAPVVDDSGKIIGIITEKDLLVALDFMGEKYAKDTVIDGFMSRDIISFSENAPVNDILRMLVRENIKRVPIVEDGKIIGIVARRDILKSAIGGHA